MQELGLKEYFAIGYYFVGEEKKIPLVLDAYAKNQLDLSDVNRVLELSSIKEFFDKYDYVNAWNDDYYRKYKELSRNAEKEVRLFFQSITENAIVPIYNVCKVIFWDEFWKYFYIYKVYDKISAEHFKEIADGLRIPPNELLKNKNLVEKFDTQITEMLKNPEYGARFIVDYYMRKDNGKTKCYFPKSLTKEDKYNIIKAYINGDIVNINILDLIINGKSKKSKEFDVDAKLRHLAKKRSERYWNNNTTSVFEYETGVEVSFSPENPDQDLDFSDGIIIAKYNSDWIKNNLDYPTLLNNFIYLFGYTDICMRCLFTARSLKQGIFEKMVSVQGNGFETHIIDGQYPERKCAAIYSKRDLEKWFNLLTMRTSLKHVMVDKKIAGRYYQEAAIKAVCNSFDEKNRRKALLVMATGSGKTRTVIALCDILLKSGWVKNILFLADRNSLVTQAKRSFVNMLPNLSCTNLVEEKDNYNAHCVFSTYQTMMNCIDTVNDNIGKLFTCGHFDLTYEDTLVVREEVAPLILPDGDEVNAIRFDALMYGIELAYLVGKKYTKH